MMAGTMSGIPSVIVSRVDRWTGFLEGRAPSRIFLIRWAPGLQSRPWANPGVRHERLDWIRRNYEWHLERAGWLEDDTVPCLDLFTGTELFAEAFGCRVHRPEDNMPFALPLVESAGEADRLVVPTLEAGPLAFAFALADELRRWAGPGAPVRLVDLQSPLDVAALIWEKQSFYTALIEEPEAVERLLAKVKALQFSFLDEWFRRYGRPSVAHYPDYLLPRGVSLSVDEVGAMSPAMFDRWVLPALEEEASIVRHVVYHWDGPDARVHTDSLVASAPIRTLSYVPGAGRGTHVDYVGMYKGLQARGKAVQVGGSIDEVKQMHKELAPELTMYYTYASSPAEANELLEWFVKHT